MGNFGLLVLVEKIDVRSQMRRLVVAVVNGRIRRLQDLFLDHLLALSLRIVSFVFGEYRRGGF